MIDLSNFPDKDSDWTEEDWFNFLIYLKENGITSYKEMAASVLGALNPPQVGTQVASNKNIQAHFGPSIIRKSKFPQNPKRSVRFSGKRTKRSVQKRKARNTQKAETKVL